MRTSPHKSERLATTGPEGHQHLAEMVALEGRLCSPIQCHLGLETHVFFASSSLDVGAAFLLK